MFDRLARITLLCFFNILCLCSFSLQASGGKIASIEKGDLEANDHRIGRRLYSNATFNLVSSDIFGYIVSYLSYEDLLGLRKLSCTHKLLIDECSGAEFSPLGVETMNIQGYKASIYPHIYFSQCLLISRDLVQLVPLLNDVKDLEKFIDKIPQNKISYLWYVETIHAALEDNEPRYLNIISEAVGHKFRSFVSRKVQSLGANARKPDDKVKLASQLLRSMAIYHYICWVKISDEINNSPTLSIVSQQLFERISGLHFDKITESIYHGVIDEGGEMDHYIEIADQSLDGELKDIFQNSISWEACLKDRYGLILSRVNFDSGLRLVLRFLEKKVLLYALKNFDKLIGHIYDHVIHSDSFIEGDGFNGRLYLDQNFLDNFNNTYCKIDASGNGDNIDSHFVKLWLDEIKGLVLPDCDS